jgi:hypothetical protein
LGRTLIFGNSDPINPSGSGTSVIGRILFKKIFESLPDIVVTLSDTISNQDSRKSLYISNVTRFSFDFIVSGTDTITSQAVVQYQASGILVE